MLIRLLQVIVITCITVPPVSTMNAQQPACLHAQRESDIIRNANTETSAMARSIRPRLGSSLICD